MSNSVVKEEISKRFKCELYYEFIKKPYEERLRPSYITMRPNINAKSLNELRREIRKIIMSLTDVEPDTMRITVIEETLKQKRQNKFQNKIEFVKKTPCNALRCRAFSFAFTAL